MKSLPPLKDAINCIHGHNDAPFHPASLQNAFMVFHLLVHLKSDRFKQEKNGYVKWPLLSCFGKFQKLSNTATPIPLLERRGEGMLCTFGRSYKYFVWSIHHCPVSWSNMEIQHMKEVMIPFHGNFKAVILPFWWGVWWSHKSETHFNPRYPFLLALHCRTWFHFLGQNWCV